MIEIKLEYHVLQIEPHVVGLYYKHSELGLRHVRNLDEYEEEMVRKAYQSGNDSGYTRGYCDGVARRVKELG